MREKKMKNSIIFKLSQRIEHKGLTGHCQHTYLSKNEKGQTLVYCLQQKNHTSVRLMRCSLFGEPSHEIELPKDKIFKFELPEGDSILDILCREWIKQNEK